MRIVQIVSAGRDEAARLAALGRETYRDHFAAMWQESEMNAWLDDQFDATAIATEIAEGRATYLVCEVGEDDAGFAKIRWARPLPGQSRSGAELQKIYFRAAHAGHGYGGQLLADCVDHAAAHGEPCLWLEVLKSNERAKNLYERAGFRIAGERNFDRAGTALPMWLMVRALGPTQADA